MHLLNLDKAVVGREYTPYVTKSLHTPRDHFAEEHLLTPRPFQYDGPMKRAAGKPRHQWESPTPAYGPVLGPTSAEVAKGIRTPRR